MRTKFETRNWKIKIPDSSRVWDSAVRSLQNPGSKIENGKLKLERFSTFDLRASEGSR